jgi:hypothetical protein
MINWAYDWVLPVVTVSVPYWIAFLIGETRRRIRVGHWR